MSAGGGELLRLVDAYVRPSSDDAERSRCLAAVVTDVATPQALLALLVAMQDYLVHADGAIRRRAVGLLAELVRRGEPGMVAAARPRLVQFFCDRLGDAPCVPECVGALTAFVAAAAPAGGAAAPAIAAAVLSVRMRGDGAGGGQAHATRRAVYELLERLLACASLRPLPLATAAGVIECVDGEADPRALLVALRLLRCVGAGWSEALAPLAAPLFDVSSCYFPVVFTPPPGVGAITRPQLAGALSGVFASTRGLAPLVLPFLIDKLGSSVAAAKVDSLAALAEAAPVYAVAGGLRPHFGPLRDALLAEALGDDRCVAEVACGAARALARAVAAECERVGDARDWAGFGGSLLGAAAEAASEGDSREGRGAARLIAAVASGSEFCFRAVAGGAVPALLAAHGACGRPAGRAALVSALAEVAHAIDADVAIVAAGAPAAALSSARSLFLSVLATRGPAPLSAPVASVAARLGAGDAAASREGARAAARGLADLVARPPLPVLSEAEVRAVVGGLVGALSAEDDVVASAALDALAAIGAKARPYAAMVASAALPALTGDLTRGAPPAALRATVRLAAACVSEFHAFLGPLVAAAFDAAGAFSAAAPAVLSALALVLPSVCGDAGAASACIVGVAPGSPSLLASIVCAAVGAGGGASSAAGLDGACDAVVRAVLTRAALEHRRGVVLALTALFLGEPMAYSAEQAWLAPFAACPVPAPRRRVLPFLRAAIEAAPELTRVEDVTAALLSLVSREAGDVTAASQCLAALMLRAPGAVLDGLVVTVVHAALLPAARGGAEEARAGTVQQAIVALAWCTRALCVRAHRDFVRVVGCYVDVVATGGGAAGMCAAASIGIPLIPAAAGSSTGVGLHQQRYFTVVFGALRSALTADGPHRAPILLGLCNLLIAAPKQLVLSEVDTAILLALQGLSDSDAAVQTAALLALAPLISDSTLKIAPHLSTVVPRLLRLTTFLGSARVRAVASETLSLLVRLPYYKVHPFMPEVIRGLLPALDDTRRAVRRRAAACRNEWCVGGGRRGAH